MAASLLKCTKESSVLLSSFSIHEGGKPTEIHRLFQTEPDLKRLFPKIVQMNEKNELEWEVDKDMLQRHAVTVMEGLGAAVESLDDSDFLNSVLVSIGQTHVKRNVKPQMLRVTLYLRPSV